MKYGGDRRRNDIFSLPFRVKFERFHYLMRKERKGKEPASTSIWIYEGREEGHGGKGSMEDTLAVGKNPLRAVEC